MSSGSTALLSFALLLECFDFSANLLWEVLERFDFFEEDAFPASLFRRLGRSCGKSLGRAVRRYSVSSSLVLIRSGAVGNASSSAASFLIRRKTYTN